jgi:Protein of unknown function (DUF1573)
VGAKPRRHRRPVGRWLATLLIAVGGLIANGLPAPAAVPPPSRIGVPVSQLVNQRHVVAHQPQLQARAGSMRQGTVRSAAAAPVGGAWTALGPQPINGLSTYGPVSGRVTALAANGSTVYAGAADGGVWKSTDGGAHWQVLTENKANVPTLAIGALAVDWTTNTIYAGTGEANLCQDCLPSQGVLISKDAGATWTLGGQSTFTAQAFFIGGLVVDRTNTLRLFAATNRGLYESTDAGLTWSALATSAGRADTVVQDPSDPTKFWVTESTDCTTSASPGTIGYWSTGTPSPGWHVAWPGTSPSLGLNAIRIGLGVGTGNTLYAAVAACQNMGQLAGVLKSVDDGQHWAQLGGVPDFFSSGTTPAAYQGWYDNVVGVDPSNPNDAVFGGITAVTTTNGGLSFSDVARPYSGGPLHPDFHAVAFDGVGTVYVGNDGGVWSSSNFGQSWTNLNTTLSITQFYSGTALDLSQITGGSQDNGTAGIVPGGSAAPTWTSLLDGDGGWTAMTRNSPTFFAEAAGLDMFRINDATGAATEIAPSCPAPFTAAGCSEPTGFIAPFVMDRGSINPPPPNVVVPVTLYAGTNRVYATNDAGSTWGIISGDLTTDVGTVPNDHPADFINTMNTGAGSTSNTLLTASWFGRVFINTGLGTTLGTWKDITGNLPAWSAGADSGNAWITGVAVNPLDNHEAWVTIGTVSGPRVWHTTRAGTANTWADISTTLPANLVVDSITVDPITPQTIYIGTDAGAMVCQVCGGPSVVDAWAPLGTNLPNVRVDAITLTADSATVVAWTHGRGAWYTQVPITRPGADLSPTRVDFGVQNFAMTSAPRSVTLKNTGSAALAITSITSSGDFQQSNTCGAAVAPGSSCTVSVTVTPSGPGTRNGTLTVNDNAADSPQTANLTATGAQGYWLVARDGGIFTFGSAKFYGSTGAIRLNQPVVGMGRTSTDGGYWLVASDGGIFTFGDALFLGSTGSITLNQPIVGMAPTPDDRGYWLVASDGGIFTFGDAPFKGSTGSLRLNKPIVGMASTPTGQGYWLVASDGGIFSFGDAAFLGSTGSIALNKPIVGMAATPSGSGYWMVASDGGIFTFGDAKFDGSEGGTFLFQPIVGMAATRDGGGYWMVASDGGIFSFGDAFFAGSMGGNTLNQPIVGMAGS